MLSNVIFENTSLPDLKLGGVGKNADFQFNPKHTIRQNDFISRLAVALWYLILGDATRRGKMTKKPPLKELPVLRSHEILSARELLEIRELDIETYKMEEVARLIRLPENLSEEKQNTRIVRALDLYESLAPSDGLEGMLAAQMVGTHLAALECLRLAAVPQQSFAARDMNLKNATKLMALYAQQVAALNKHRGKGQQKVTVEHVHVEAGGQAIVGNVESSSRAEHPGTRTAAIEHQVDVPSDAGRKKASSRRRKPKAE